jgi:hypothetical protein
MVISESSYASCISAFETEAFFILPLSFVLVKASFFTQ